MEWGGGSLTSDADVGFAALGGPCRAPGNTLTPEVLGPKQLLHLLPSDLYAGLSHYQSFEGNEKGDVLAHINREQKPSNQLKQPKMSKHQFVLYTLPHTN